MAIEINGQDHPTQGLANGTACNAVDEERSQSIARIVIVAISFVIFCMFVLVWRSGGGPDPLLAIAITGSYLAFAVVWLQWVRKRPGIYVWRRLATMITDFAMITYAMHSIGVLGPAIYPLYLWVIVGNGMRFGPRYLFAATLLGVAGFASVVFLDPQWQLLRSIGISLLFAMVILSAFYLVLIRRLHLLNQRLDRALRKSEYMATHDALTGLANRHSFMTQVNDAILRVKRYGGGFGILFIDLDGFKAINDRRGHEAGDQILIEVAKRLTNLTRQSDLIGRWGGDEFVMLLHMMSDAENSKDFAQKTVEDLARQYPVDNTWEQLSASVGICIYAGQKDLADELIRKADAAMYQAKKGGKNGYACHA